jgi:hypothetical protein
LIFQDTRLARKHGRRAASAVEFGFDLQNDVLRPIALETKGKPPLAYLWKIACNGLKPKAVIAPAGVSRL